jgi:cysteinyl-tRNA synthetase
MVEGTKMSKSKGNFFTVRQILNGDFTGSAVDPAVLRLEMIKASYRSQMNFTKRGLEDSAANVRKLRDFVETLEREAGDQVMPEVDTHEAVVNFKAALADDLNTAGALGVVFGFVSQPVDDPAEALAVMRQFDRVLAVLESSESGSSDTTWAERLAGELDQARAAKDYSRADAIRDELQASGYEVKTTKEGTVASKRLA